MQHGDQRGALAGQRVFNLGRHLRIFLADDQRIGLQLLEHDAEGLEGDAAEMPLEFVVPQHGVFRQRVQDQHLVLAPDQGQGVAKCRIAQGHAAGGAGFFVHRVALPVDPGAEHNSLAVMLVSGGASINKKSEPPGSLLCAAQPGPAGTIRCNLSAFAQSQYFASRRTDEQLTWTADFLLWVGDHFAPLGNPADGAGHDEPNIRVQFS